MGSRAEVTTLLLLLLLSTTLKSTGGKVGRKACLRGNFEELLLLFGNTRQAFLKEQIVLFHVPARFPAVPPDEQKQLHAL